MYRSMQNIKGPSSQHIDDSKASMVKYFARLPTKVDENALGLHDKFNYELSQGMQPRTLLESGQYKSGGGAS